MGYRLLILRNLRRHPLRLALTAVGIAVVIVAFNLIVTTVQAWYASADQAVPDRLISRHAASLSIHLPLAYKDRLATIPGVTGVTYANWFGAVYRDAKGFFPQFAVEPASYLDLHPELVVSDEARRAFLADRRGVLIGRSLAELYGWRVGDTIPLTGTLYPGDLEFIVRGIYSGVSPSTDTGTFLLRWDYMNERRRLIDPDRAGTVGWYVIRIADPAQAGVVAKSIDALFANSASETRTETEQAFQLGFVALSGSLIAALKALALALNAITLLVLANTLAMGVRERTRELAVLRAIGFEPRHLLRLLFGEALLIGSAGALLGLILSIPVCYLWSLALTAKLGNFFQHLTLTPNTVALSTGVTFCAAIAAALVPTVIVLRTKPLDGLRHLG